MSHDDYIARLRGELLRAGEEHDGRRLVAHSLLPGQPASSPRASGQTPTAQRCPIGLHLPAGEPRSSASCAPVRQVGAKTSTPGFCVTAYDGRLQAVDATSWLYTSDGVR